MELVIPRSAAKRTQMELGNNNGSKWYCRTCNIHCENHKIFLNHLTTENHRQRKHFSQNFQTSERQKLSEKFVDGFMETLSKFKRKRVPVCIVIKAYNLQSNSISIEDTQWKSVHDFLHSLKCCNKCQVNETFELIQEFEKGNSELFDIFERRKNVTKVKRDSLCPYVRKMLKLDKDNKSSSTISEKEKLSRVSHEKITFSFSKRSRKISETSKLSDENSAENVSELDQQRLLQKVGDVRLSSNATDHLDVLQNDQERTKLSEDIGKEMKKCINSFSYFSELKTKETTKLGKKKQGSTKRKRSALEDIKVDLESERDHQNRTVSWVTLGLKVRISSHFAGKQNIGKRGTVVYCSISEDNYLIVIKDSKETVSARQQDLQTVIPNLGSPVRIVNGGYRGLNAVLDSVNKQYLASVHITNGLLSGRVVNNVHLNDICDFTDVTFK